MLFVDEAQCAEEQEIQIADKNVCKIQELLSNKHAQFHFESGNEAALKVFKKGHFFEKQIKTKRAVKLIVPYWPALGMVLVPSPPVPSKGAIYIYIYI